MRDRIAPDKAGSEEHNGDIWSRSPTQYGTILAAKIVLFLLGISISNSHSFFLSMVIDEASRERFIYAYNEHSSYSTIDFTERAIIYFGYLLLYKIDKKQFGFSANCFLL